MYAFLFRHLPGPLRLRIIWLILLLTAALTVLTPAPIMSPRARQARDAAGSACKIGCSCGDSVGRKARYIRIR